VNPEKAYKSLASMLENPENTAKIKAACHAIRQLKNGDFTDLLLPLLQHNDIKADVAATIAALILDKARSLLDCQLLKNRRDLKVLLTGAFVENLQKHCQQK
jgi:hypothetical protein